jgi:hypothetical protein
LAFARRYKILFGRDKKTPTVEAGVFLRHWNPFQGVTNTNIILFVKNTLPPLLSLGGREK